jgi:hypothetical protein
MVIALGPTNDDIAKWLKTNFRQVVREYFAAEITGLWNEFVGDTPELKKVGGGDFLPDADLSQEVHARKTEVEKVLAFKPIADGFLDEQEEAVENYISEHIDYLKGLLHDKVGSSVGRPRAELVMQLADELSPGADDPPAMLVAIYVVKHGNRFRG